VNAEVVDCRVREAVDRAPDVSYVLRCRFRYDVAGVQHVAAFSTHSTSDQPRRARRSDRSAARQSDDDRGGVSPGQALSRLVIARWRSRRSLARQAVA
jgi:hypothetical protein